MNRATTPSAQAPIKRFAKATKACAIQVRLACEIAARPAKRHPGANASLLQAATYGACVGKRYQDVQRGMCADEFKAFKECVQVSRTHEMLGLALIEHSAWVQTQMGRKW